MRSNTERLLPAIATLAALIAVCTLTIWGQTQNSSKAAPGSTSSQAGIKLQPLNVKPGLWRTTTNMTVAGQMPVPADMLNRLTPEQRARMEARMKAHSAAHSNTETHQSCLTKEDLEHYKSDFATDDKCRSTILSSSNTRAKAKITCDVEGMRGNGTYEVEAIDPEHVKGSSKATMTGNGQTRNVDGTFSSEWLSSSCENLK
jgi:hypothetical protein